MIGARKVTDLELIEMAGLPKEGKGQSSKAGAEQGSFLVSRGPMLSLLQFHAGRHWAVSTAHISVCGLIATGYWRAARARFFRISSFPERGSTPMPRPVRADAKAKLGFARTASNARPRRRRPIAIRGAP